MPRRLCIPLLALALPGAVMAQQAGSLQAEYEALARPALTQTTAVHNLELDWNGLHFLMVSGELALGAPIEGHITTAVFDGEGTVRVDEPGGARQAIERAQIERYLPGGQISGSMSQAVFRFADGDAFAHALHPGAGFAAAAGSGRTRGVLEDRAKRIEKLGLPTLARVWRALDAGSADNRLLLAEVKLEKAGWVSMEFDPSRTEPLRVAGDEIWTEYAPPGMAGSVPAARLGPYRLDVDIPGNLDLGVKAGITVAGGGGLLLSLSSQLRVTSVTGAGAAWYQPERGDWLYVRLGRSLAPGKSASLQISYRGKGALQPALAGHDWIAPGDWYPALIEDAPPPPTTFDLRITADKKYQVLSTPSGMPVRSAGFTVGEDESSQNQAVRASGKPMPITVAAPRDEDPKAMMALGGTKLADILSYMDAAVGPYAGPALAASLAGEDEGGGGHAIPGVVIFDPRSFVGAAPALTELAPGLSAAAQWWGLSTVAATAHDEWLIAGLRQASGLFYQESRYGRDAGHDTVDAWRHYLLTAPPGGHGRVPEDAGPLWLGAERLDAPFEPGSDLLLAKGGYVIYMLRQMMRTDASPTPDAAFTAMLREFFAKSRGSAATTAEFQAVVEKHMTPAMDLDHNHKMDWFFRPLIYGTAVPQLTFHAASAAPVKGVGQVTLTVENPQHWRGLLPVYIFRDETTWVRGLMPITHDHETLTVPVPFAPQYVEANHFGDMLVRVYGLR